MTIHQLVHTLSYGDAISSEVLSLKRCFRSMGHDGEIYALHVHPKLKGKAKLFKELPKDSDYELVLHYSLGSPLNERYLGLNEAKRTLIYHNLTPPNWFKGVNPRIVRDIEEGRKELPKLCQVSDRILADSEFNAEELKSLGYNASVLELSLDPERWGILPNAGIKQAVLGSPGPHLLHVGRLAPNKCIEDIIKIFYFVWKVVPTAKLWLVGIDTDTELYSFALKQLVYSLGMEEAVEFMGCRDDSEVRSLYESSTVYLCMSEHEGFCLPIVEAMRYGLPVIAFNSSAVPYTMARAGILVSEKRHAEIAELVLKVRDDEELRNRLVERGRARAQELSFDNFERRVVELFSENLQERAISL